MQVEVLAWPGTGPNHLAFGHIEVGLLPGTYPSQCGPTDDRVLSADPRAARLLPVGCTGWIIDDCNHCMLTAGHCIATPEDCASTYVVFGYTSGYATGGSPSFPEAQVFACTSRINHSCAPNCHHEWNGALGKETLHAVRRIERGEVL